MLRKSLLFECTTDSIEARSRAFPGEAEEAAAALAGQVLLMMPTAKFFQFWHLEALHARGCAQAATIPPLIVVTVAPPHRVSPLALLPGCSDSASLEVFYDTASYNGVCDTLRLYLGLDDAADIQDAAPAAALAFAHAVAAGASGGGGGTSSKSPSKRSGAEQSTAYQKKAVWCLLSFMLRTGSTRNLIASLFNVSRTSATRYYTIWICFLNEFLSDMFT